MCDPHEMRVRDRKCLVVWRADTSVLSPERVFHFWWPDLYMHRFNPNPHNPTRKLNIAVDYEYQEYLNTVRISPKGIACNCPCRISGNYVSIHIKTHIQVNITSPKASAVWQSLHFLTSLPLIHLWTFCHLCGGEGQNMRERKRGREKAVFWRMWRAFTFLLSLFPR